MFRKNDIKPYLEAARPHYGGKDPGHDFRHILRIADRLEALSRGLTPPPVICRLNFLCAFHGLGGMIKSRPQLRDQVSAFLIDLGWQEDEISFAYDQLDTHLSDPQTSEQKIVHDANFFEVTGAFGIAKAFTVGGVYGQTYEETLAIFQANLDKLAFKTPFGRNVYARRIAITRDFIENLKSDLKLGPLSIERRTHQ